MNYNHKINSLGNKLIFDIFCKMCFDHFSYFKMLCGIVSRVNIQSNNVHFNIFKLKENSVVENHYTCVTY